MITRTLGVSLSILAILSPIRAATAIDSLSTEELASHCAHYIEGVNYAETDAIFCVRYIQGFIDGAIATDGRVVQNVEEERAQAESFIERAFRTRTPRRNDKSPTFYAGFCLSTPVPLKEVTAKVVHVLENEHIASRYPEAREAVYSVLVKDYPCQAE